VERTLRIKEKIKWEEIKTDEKKRKKEKTGD
jgi:hypothetical protein